jgi:hypothetical protein
MFDCYDNCDDGVDKVGEEDTIDNSIFILNPFAILLVSITRTLIVSFPKSIFPLGFFWTTFTSKAYFVSAGRLGAIKLRILFFFFFC